MKKILIITAFEPGNKAAGQAYTAHLLADLATSHQIELCYFYEASESSKPNIPDGVKVLCASPLSSWRRLLGALSCPFFHPLFTSRFSLKKAWYFRSIAHQFDVIYFDFSQIFIYALFIKHPNKIALAHDVITQMYRRQTGLIAKIHRILSQWTERIVLQHLGAQLYCLSDKDCLLVNTLFDVKAKQVDIYLDAYIYRLELNVAMTHLKQYAFYGAWYREENSAGLLWFIEQVLPWIPQGSRFIVIGSGVPPTIHNAARIFAERIDFVGFVDNPYHLIASCQALIAPLFHGAGVKVKVLESLACGTPVIGTAIAFEGIAPHLLLDCVQCDTANAFIQAISINTYEDNHTQIRRHFLQHYPKLTMGQVLRGQ